jgi:DNA-binding MarR family transcriptional regulator
MLRQTQDPDDGRGRLLRLTRKGSSLYASVGATAKSIETSLAGGLNKSEWNSLHRTLGKLIGHVRTLMAAEDDEG